MSIPCERVARFSIVVGFLGIGAVAGCSRPGVPAPRVIEYDYDPLQVARRYLEGYADGIPVGSERELFPKLVEEIRTVDADKAAALESGLAEIVKSRATAAARAKKLLGSL